MDLLEAETLVELALEFISHVPDPVLVDVGTGSGCTGGALAVHAPSARVYALDLSSHALRVAQANALRCRVRTVGAIETLKDVFQLLLRDSIPFVSNLNLQAFTS